MTMFSMFHLIPCRCGSGDVESKYTDDTISSALGAKRWFVECAGCGNRGPLCRVGEAEAAWNRQEREAAIRQVLATLHDTNPGGETL